MDQRVAFITGAGSGIGRATALAYARKGVAVAILDLSEQAVHETAAEIRSLYKTPCLHFECDVTVAEDVRFAVLETVEHLGAIDFAFNNAGSEGFPAKVADITEENWDGVMNVNLRGVWLCMKYELHQMLKQGQGAIVNCAGIAGMVGEAGRAPLVASKHGVVGLTKTAALDYALDNIRVNAVCPGVVQTKVVERYLSHYPGHQQELVSGVPLQRMATADEVAAAVLWLNSPEASYITGDTLVIDGGRLSHA